MPIESKLDKIIKQLKNLKRCPINKKKQKHIMQTISSHYLMLKFNKF